MNKKKQQCGRLKQISLRTKKQAGTREAAWRAISRRRKKV